MNKILLLLIALFSIFEIISGHLMRNDLQIGNGTQIMKAQTSLIARNLLEIEKQVSYVLQITGLDYVGMFIYGIGMRIVGMQNLLVWQIVHLYQQSQSEVTQLYFNIEEYINGYTDPNIFTFQGFGYGYLFSKLNLFWEVGTVLFCIGVLGRFLIGPWFKYKAMGEMEKRNVHKNSKKQIQVQIAQQHNFTQGNFIKDQISQNRLMNSYIKTSLIANKINQSTKHQKPQQKKQQKLPFSKLRQEKKSFIHPDYSNNSKIMGVSTLQTFDGSNVRNKPSKIKKTQSIFLHQIEQQNVSQIEMKNINRTQNQPKAQQSKINLKQQAIQLNQNPLYKEKNANQNSQQMKDNYRYFKQIQRYSNILLKQVVFNILINSIAISSYGAVRQIMYQSVQEDSHSLSYSGGFILITQLFMLLITFGLVLKRQVGSGENRDKFKIASYGNAIYWSVTILQRLVYGSILATRWKYSIIVIASLKLTILILSKFINLWKVSSHYYRYLSQNFIHLLIFLVLILDQFYLRSSNQKFDLSKISIAWILFSLLIVSFLVNFYFIVKESGFIRWVKNATGFSSSKNLHEPNKVNTQTPNILNQYEQNMQQNQSEATKRVKFNIHHQQIIPVTLSKKTQTSLPKSQILEEVSQRKYQDKNEQKNQRIKRLPSKSQSLIKINSNYPSKQKPYKFYAKTYKNIENDIDDAQRAQKTQHVAIQQTKQYESYNQDEAQIVSIQLNNKNTKNPKSKTHDEI